MPFKPFDLKAYRVGAPACVNVMYVVFLYCVHFVILRHSLHSVFAKISSFSAAV